MSLLTDLASPLPKPNASLAPRLPPVGAAADVPLPPPATSGSLPAWMTRRRLRRVASLPLVCSTFVPLVFLDLWFSLFQAVGFPLLGIPKVRRRDHFAAGRSRLPPVHVLDKVHGACCRYADGVLSFAGEIVARMERCWHPALQARPPAPAPTVIHDRQFVFLQYGDFARSEDLARAMHAGVAAESGDEEAPGQPPASTH